MPCDGGPVEPLFHVEQYALLLPTLRPADLIAQSSIGVPVASASAQKILTAGCAAARLDVFRRSSTPQFQL